MKKTVTLHFEGGIQGGMVYPVQVVLHDDRAGDVLSMTPIGEAESFLCFQATEVPGMGLLWAYQIFEDPSKAVGMYPVFRMSDGGMSACLIKVKEITTDEATAVSFNPEKVVLVWQCSDCSLKSEAPVSDVADAGGLICPDCDRDMIVIEVKATP